MDISYFKCCKTFHLLCVQMAGFSTMTVHKGPAGFIFFKVIDYFIYLFI